MKALIFAFKIASSATRAAGVGGDSQRDMTTQKMMVKRRNAFGNTILAMKSSLLLLTSFSPPADDKSPWRDYTPSSSSSSSNMYRLPERPEAH